MKFSNNPENLQWAYVSKLFLLIVILCFSMTVVGYSQPLDYLPEAPYYKTYKKHSVNSGKIVHFPITVDEQIFEEFYYQDRIEPLQSFLFFLNEHLDSLKISFGLPTDFVPPKGNPYVFVGSSEAETAPPGSEMMRQEHDKFPPMIIYLKKPSREWKKLISRTLADHGMDYLMVIAVGLAEYPKANKGIFKKKVVLGTHYEPEIRFLSAENKPVEVLQLTGMLINRDGEVVRAGAEGIFHEDTQFWAQIFNIEKGIDDRQIEDLILNYRREDLPGRPIAWKKALETLLQYLGDKDL